MLLVYLIPTQLFQLQVNFRYCYRREQTLMTDKRGFGQVQSKVIDVYLMNNQRVSNIQYRVNGESFKTISFSICLLKFGIRLHIRLIRLHVK